MSDNISKAYGSVSTKTWIHIAYSMPLFVRVITCKTDSWDNGESQLKNSLLMYVIPSDDQLDV